MSSDNQHYLVKIETLQPTNFKALFNVLKENNILEANVNITANGLEILELDPTHIVIVHVFLNSNTFESYFCKKPIKIGLDIVNLTKILKGISAKDILTIFLEDPESRPSPSTDSDINTLFGLLIENSKKGQISRYYIDAMDVNEQQISVPQLDYPYHIQIPSADLQSIVNQMKNMGGEVIKILFHDDELQFFTKGELGLMNTIRTQTPKSDESIKIHKNQSSDSSMIIELYLKLEKMVEFTKCACLSPIVTIYIRNDYPLFLEYDVGSLGFIRLGLSPHIKPDNW